MRGRIERGSAGTIFGVATILRAAGSSRWQIDQPGRLWQQTGAVEEGGSEFTDAAVEPTAFVRRGAPVERCLLSTARLHGARGLRVCVH
jgi:hypothetical protein